MDTSGQPEMFNHMRNCSYLPASKLGKGGGEGRKAAQEKAQEKLREQEEFAYDEHLTSQERFRRYQRWQEGQERKRNRQES